MECNGKWIWYPGDYEIHHHLKVSLRREERGYQWPAFWRLDDCCHNIRFRKNGIKIEATDIIVAYGHELGYIAVDGKKYAFGENIKIDPGIHDFEAVVACEYGLPCLYIEGREIISDDSWEVDDYTNHWLRAGCMGCYSEQNSDPEIFPFVKEQIEPVECRQVKDGQLYDFGKQTFASLVFTKLTSEVTVYYGESEEEALDTEYSYLWEKLPAGNKEYHCVPRAFRYLYIKGEEQKFTVWYERLNVNQRAEFMCDDPLISRIWNTAAYTFLLNCREFYLDGIKRDRWVWSGDTYQSIYTNHYLLFDPEITKRTLTALRGRDPVTGHINTIVDYSFYWIISVGLYYLATKDLPYIEFIYPRMHSLMDYCMEHTDEDGLLRGREKDWIFIDWAEIDKTGAACAIQMLYAEALRVFAELTSLLDKQNDYYLRRAVRMKELINQLFWDEEKGAYVDSFESGRRNVTRQTNIFAIRYRFVDEKKRNSIIQKVILNPAVPQISTPFFKLFELEVMCEIGRLDYVTNQLKSYWGEMLKIGVTTFWEEFDASVTGKEKYGMYGDPFGKSLCHAWGASPVYLLGRYYFGVYPTSAGYETYEVCPDIGGLKRLKGMIPINGGEVSIEITETSATISTTKSGGTLVVKEKRYELVPDRVYTMEIA